MSTYSPPNIDYGTRTIIFYCKEAKECVTTIETTWFQYPEGRVYSSEKFKLTVPHKEGDNLYMKLKNALVHLIKLSAREPSYKKNRSKDPFDY